MHRYISLAFLLSVLNYSCTKTNSGGTPPPPPPPGGTGSGISITSLSPLTPYYGDTITITGTGFDADITKDTVSLVYSPDGISFSSLYSVNNLNLKIISATTTQIKFFTDRRSRIPPGQPQTIAVHVSSPSKSGLTKNILSFK